jgi:hypothetical protein
MVTFAVPAPALAVAVPEVALTAEDALAADELELDSVFLSSLEQPDSPATRTAAPATATTKPRFTDFSFVEVIRRNAGPSEKVWDGNSGQCSE